MCTPLNPRDVRIDEDVQRELNELIEGLREEFQYYQRILCDLEEPLPGPLLAP